MKEKISLNELKEFFREHYGYIDMELTDKELLEFLHEANKKGYSLPRTADMLSDLLLASGAFAQE